MKDDSRQLRSRRELLGAAARAGALGALAALAALLGRRRGRPGRDDHRCVNQGICRGCRAFDRCILPQAASARRARGGSDRG
ncbi:MAG TPA: hypothetical protein VNA25_12500 [Phycisphaerae bacterium]|nr:hypothetical protein [Phycisphaerae bacterium]